jgi:hypothetical protein
VTERRLELASTVLLALAAVATAWAAHRLAATAQADALERRAAAGSARSKQANERAVDYMLGVVLFSMALFFAGISAKLDTPRMRGVVLGLGAAIFLGAFVWVATFPIRV